MKHSTKFFDFLVVSRETQSAVKYANVDNFCCLGINLPFFYLFNQIYVENFSAKTSKNTDKPLYTFILSIICG